MVKLIFNVFDSKGNCYLDVPMFNFKSKADAIRAFSDLINGKKDNQIAQHPEDFTLFYMGEYNVLTGQVTNASTPESLGVGIYFLKDNSPKFPTLQETIQ